MAFLGDEGRAFPGAYKAGTGTITQLNDGTAYAKPDQPNYGHYIYIHGGLADKSCSYKLNTKYKVGDRISFTYVKAMRPERGCEWAAINLAKIGGSTNQQQAVDGKNGGGKPSSSSAIKKEEDKEEDDDGYDNGSDETDDVKSVVSGISNITTTNSKTRAGSAGYGTLSAGNSMTNVKYIGKKGIIPNATGYIDYNGISFAKIKLYPPHEGRAFMNNRSVNGSFIDQNGVFSLAKAFPQYTMIVCDLQSQPERHECRYFALNVVVDKSSSSKEQGKEKSAATSFPLAGKGKFAPSSGLGYRPPPPGFQKFNPAVQLPTKQPAQKFDDSKVKKEPNDASSKKNEPNSNKNDYDSKKPSAAAAAKPAVNDASIQTDIPIEATLLEKIFDDQEIFRQICTRLPDVMFRYHSIRRRTE